jgi:hypothetical protein
MFELQRNRSLQGQKAIAMTIDRGPILQLASLVEALNHSLSKLNRLSTEPSIGEKEQTVDFWSIQTPTPVTTAQAADITAKVSLLLSHRFPYIEARQIKDLVSKSVESRLNGKTGSEVPEKDVRESKFNADL